MLPTDVVFTACSSSHRVLLLCIIYKLHNTGCFFFWVVVWWIFLFIFIYFNIYFCIANASIRYNYFIWPIFCYLFFVYYFTFLYFSGTRSDNLWGVVYSSFAFWRIFKYQFFFLNWNCKSEFTVARAGVSFT